MNKTVGIYALVFKDNSTYIGQSLDISKRRTTHLRSLKNNTHHNKLVQGKFNKFGIPEFIIIEECSESLLNQKEIEYCKLINPQNLLNIAEPGVSIVGMPGDSNGRSKYSNEEIIKVLMALSNTDISKKELAKISPVSYTMIRQIASGTAHAWLKEVYPVEYDKMLSKIKQKVPFTVKSPTGQLFTGVSQRGFAAEHGLCSTMFNQLIHKKRKELLGWVLVSTDEVKN